LNKKIHFEVYEGNLYEVLAFKSLSWFPNTLELIKPSGVYETVGDGF
jgi:hypothetical protein